MSKTYRAVVLKGKGGLEQLEVRDLLLEAPPSGHVRIRVLAAGAGATDLTMRTGSYPYRPPFRSLSATTSWGKSTRSVRVSKDSRSVNAYAH